MNLIFPSIIFWFHSHGKVSQSDIKANNQMIYFIILLVEIILPFTISLEMKIKMLEMEMLSGTAGICGELIIGLISASWFSDACK